MQFWVRNRQTAVELHGEKVLFGMRVGPHENVENPEALFAVRVASINCERLTGWADTIQKSLAKSN